MPKAIWNGKVIAESEKNLKVEGNFYFPPESIKMNIFRRTIRMLFAPGRGKPVILISLWAVIPIRVLPGITHSPQMQRKK